MALLFSDSFDFYTTANLGNRYPSFVGDCSIVGGAAPRTGAGCLEVIAGAFGVARDIPQTLHVLVASMFSCQGSGNVVIFYLGNQGSAGGAAGQQGVCVQLIPNGDGSLSAQRGPSAGFGPLGTTAPGVFVFNAYNSVALECTVSAAAIVKVYCNGQLVLNLSGVDTRNAHQPAVNYINSFALMGDGLHDDVYVLDCGTPPNNSYLGAVRVFQGVPTADVSKTWTPSGAEPANYTQVDEIPPDQNTIFNSSSTIGQADQYSYPLVGLPANSQIFGVQHTMDMQVDSGSRSVTSDIGGNLNANAVALASDWTMYPWPYDLNPVTGLAWEAADFPVAAGPSVTA